MSKSRIHQMTIKEWEAAFPTEDACAEYLVRHRWPLGVTCPRCRNPECKPHGTMPFCWLCNKCSPSGTNYRFSHIAGTVFENTNKPLRDWFRVLHMMVTSKKGISALQVMRVMGFGSYKTAHYMCMRLRAAMQDQDFRTMMGIVELDETFFGGREENKHKDKRGPRGGTGSKTAVVGALQRSKKNVVARVIERANAGTIAGFVRQTIDSRMSLLATDQATCYKTLDSEYARVSVDHRAGQSARSIQIRLRGSGR